MNETHRQIVAWFEERAPEMAELLSVQGAIVLPTPRPPFQALCRAIIGQQLSTKAAATIWTRFLTLWSSRELTPEGLETMDAGVLKEVGISGGKCRALAALATAFVRAPEAYDFSTRGAGDRSDAEVIELLTAIHGIGPWTAHMFLLFTLQRPDVFAPGDLGLRKGIQKLYAFDDLPSPAEAAELARAWAPHRSVASLHLWRSLEGPASM